MSTQKVGLLGVFVFVLGIFQGNLSAAAERVMTARELREAARKGGQAMYTRSGAKLRAVAQSGSAAAAAARSSAVTIACPACTFDNPADAQQCEVCESQLPHVQRSATGAAARAAEEDPLSDQVLQRRLEALGVNVSNNDNDFEARLRALKR